MEAKDPMRETRERQAQPAEGAAPASAAKALSLSIVVVSWNGGALVPDLLAAIDAQTLPALQLVWVDNASTDDSVAQLRAWRPRPGIAVAEVLLPENRGVAGGRVAGIQAASGSALGFLDVDSVPAPTWGEEALRCLAARPRAGVLASWVLLPDGRLNGFGARLDTWGHGRDDGYGAMPGSPAAPAPTAGPTGYAMGCGMVVRAAVAHALELDPTPIKWHDDSEVALQAQALGYAVWREPSLVVVHHKGQSDAALARGEGPRPRGGERLYLAERARARLLLKYAPWPLVAANGLRDAWTAARSIRQPEVAWALIRAHGWNALHAKSALEYRQRWASAVGWTLGGPGGGDTGKGAAKSDAGREREP